MVIFGSVVHQSMARRVPSPEAEIYAAHERYRLVDDANLFVLKMRYVVYSEGCQEEIKLENSKLKTHMRP